MDAMWLLSERAIEQQKDLYMCFNDYTKFKHKKLFQLLIGLDLNGNGIRLLQNLYWGQTACMRINNETCE